MSFECGWTWAVWFGMLGIRGTNQTRRSMEQWLHERMIERGCTRDVKEARWTICMMTTWYTWKSRCKVVFEEKMPHSGIVISEIKAAIEEHGRLSRNQPTTLTSRGCERWSTPMSDVIHINCDASLCQQTGMGGLGVGAYNLRGEVEGGFNRRSRCDGVKMMEVMTILEGVKLATEQGWGKVEIELD